MIKFEFNSDTGERREREKTPKLAMPKMVYFLKHPYLQQKKSNAPMALVSAAALITEQLAFAEILKTIISILEPKPVFLKCFIRTVHFLAFLFQLSGTFQQKHYAGKCHHQQ